MLSNFNSLRQKVEKLSWFDTIGMFTPLVQKIKPFGWGFEIVTKLIYLVYYDSKDIEAAISREK